MLQYMFCFNYVNCDLFIHSTKETLEVIILLTACSENALPSFHVFHWNLLYP